MNTRKIIKLIIISALPFASFTAHAANSPNFGSSNDYTIHTTTVKTGGKTITTRATLKLGTGAAGSCNLTQPAGEFLYDFTDNIPVPVGRQYLAKFGLDYTCAQETYEPLHGNGPVSIQYRLVADKEKGIYKRAEPSEQEVNLNP